MNGFAVGVAVVLAFMLLGFAGEADYQAELHEQERYEERVCQGVHSDYKGLGVRCG